MKHLITIVTIILVAVLWPTTAQAAPAAPAAVQNTPASVPSLAGQVTHVSGWAYPTSRGTGTPTYVVRAPVLSISYSKYYTTYGWVLSPVAIYRSTSRQVTWTPPDNSWTSTINGWGYYMWGRDEPLIW